MTELAGSVVVIAGASSGIGRLTALQFARAGVHVIAAARNQRGLETLEAGASGLPGSIVGVVTDVSDWSAVQEVATAAVARHGRIDTWVNNAGIGIWATAEDTTPDEARRIVDVNVMGVIHGVSAALPIMQRQGSGVIVNVGSVESTRAMPLQSAYAASKHAVKGYTEALRVELEHDGSPVRVVLVKPSAINTPFFRHARSRLGVAPRPHPPVYEPETVAATILHVAEHPVPEVTVGGAGKALALMQRLSPRLTDYAARLTGWVGQHTDRPDDGVDNLFAPIDEHGQTHGEFGARGVSWYTRLIGVRPNVGRLASVGVVALMLGFVLRSRRPPPRA